MRRAASWGDSWKIRWDEGSIQPRECTSTREGSRAPIWSHGAAVGRGSDRGREAEHLRDGRLRVDHRDLALLADIIDHAAAALDLADRGAHEVLRDVDEHLLDRLQ